MRDTIRKLGHLKVVILITIFAVVSSLTLEYFMYKTFSFSYIFPYTPIVSFVVTIILAPLISWYFIKLLLSIDTMEQKMNNLATYDSMTKLLRRQAFFKDSLALHDTFRKTNKVYSVCIIDIDNFKSINDTYGHAYGDKVLTGFGELMNKIFNSNYIMGRIGGEEFALVMDADAETLKQEMDKLHKGVLKSKTPFKNSHIRYTVSIGIFENNIPNTVSFDEALSHADRALYEAKLTGKNKTVIFSKSLPSKDISKTSTYIRDRKS